MKTKEHLPKEHLSYSQIKLYLENPKDYFNQYVLGLPGNVHFNAGTGRIFHDTIAGLMTLKQGKKALLDSGCLPDKCRALEAAVDCVKGYGIKRHNIEIRHIFKYRNAEIPLLAYLDADDDLVIWEFKTGGWDLFQLQFYHWLVWISTGVRRPVKLVEISTTTGKCKITTFRFKDADRKLVQEKVIFAYQGITNGIWKTVN